MMNMMLNKGDKMSYARGIGLVLVGMLGYLVGGLFAWFLISLPNSSWCSKDDVASKKTITMATSYCSYSCVRR